MFSIIAAVNLFLVTAAVGTEVCTDAHSVLQTNVQRSPHTGLDEVRCRSVPFDAPFGTNCPRTPWVDAMVQADPSPGKVFMDIGCNKGDDLVEWMERWDYSGVNFWSKQKWVDHYSNALGLPNNSPTYACGTSRTTGFMRAKDIAGAPATGKSSIGVCVEPMQSNFELLRKARTALGYGPGGQYGSLHLVQAALMDKAAPGATIAFPDGPPGTETGRMSLLQVPVAASTVDALAAHLKLPRVDILTIDTEGADPAVLLGSASTLATVRYLEFEVHRDFKSSAWGHTTLKAVVEKLYLQGFDCYWAGNTGALLSMNQCWDDKFERGTWANAACVKRKDKWAAVLRRFAQ